MRSSLMLSALAIVATAMGSATLSGPASADPPPWAGGETTCEAFEGHRIMANRIGLPTRGAEVLTAQVVPASDQTTGDDGEIILPLPEHCRIVASISPVDGAAYPITVNINLPASWNGKLLQSGGGGYGGSLVTAPGNKAHGYIDPQPFDDPYPLTQGYVTFGSDTGHPRGSVDFLLNDESLRNFGGEELKKSRDVAFEVAKRFYGTPPVAVYFSGESDGGRQALVVAQRYPRDYDAVIATSPVLSWNALMLASNRVRTSLIDGGWLPADAVELIADQTRAQCDDLDGVVDRVVAKYQGCAVDAAELLCDSSSSVNCLSAQQLRSLNLIRQPWDLPFALANGIDQWPGTGVTGQEDAESDQYFTYPVGTEPPSYPLPAGSASSIDRDSGALLNFGANWVRWAIAQDPSYDPYDFDLEPYRDRISYLSEVMDATDPDLSEFARHGGKLVLIQPSADNAVSTRMVANYYQAVVAELGQARVDDFLRFYVTAGAAHNLSGIGHVDALGVADAWVTDGITPPESLMAAEQDPATLETIRSLPACQWPDYPRYEDSGAMMQADSYACTSREDPLF